MLEPVQRALASERRAPRTSGGELAGEWRQHRVVPRVIVVDQVFVAKGDAEHPLCHHGLDRVLDLRLGTVVDKAGGAPPQETDRPIVAPTSSPPASEVLSPPSDAATTWRPSTTSYPNRSRLHCVGIGGAPLRQLKSLWQKSYARFRAPMHLLAVRNPG
jgi:hypothetical protein